MGKGRRPESAVVASVEAQLDADGRWFVNVHGAGMGSASGKPDIVTCDGGGYLTTIECKAQGELPAPNQLRHAVRVLLSSPHARYVVARPGFSLAEMDAHALARAEALPDEVCWPLEARGLPTQGSFELVFAELGKGAL